MKRNLKKIIVSMAILMLIVSVMPALAWDVPSEPKPADTMWLEPSTVNLETGDTTSGYADNVGVGYTFTVIAYLNPSDNVSGWSLQVDYDSSWLNCTSAVYSGTGNIMSQLFEKTRLTSLTFPVTYTVGSVLIAEVVGTQIQPPWGTSTSSLCYLTFNVTDVPEKGETFTSDLTFYSGKEETNYSNETASTEYNVPDGTLTTVDAAVEFIWTAPPKPWFTVDTHQTNPLEKVFSKFDDANGTLFNVDVIIDNYYDGWGMTNATFCLSYNQTLINATNVVINTAEWNLVSLVNMAGWVNATVNSFSGAGYSGDPVLVATITFNVTFQDKAPPRPGGYHDDSPLAFCDETEVWNHEYTIDDPPVPGLVIIYARQAVVSPYLEVVASSSDVILGPAPAVGEEFTVSINITRLHWSWYLVGLEFRMTYCPDLMEVVSIEEGPYLQQFDQPGTPPTVFASFDEGTYIVAMDLILPDAAGNYSEPVAGADPPENGTVVIITFMATAQDVSCDPEDFFCNFTLYEILMVDKNGGHVSYDPPVNGTYTMKGSFEVGKVIDLYTQYPAPYGGQGLGKPSDMFGPQKEVILCANVTYNCWPVQQKLVTFTVWDNSDHIWTKLQGVTDENGVACVSFRLPWPCDDPESLLGVWRVLADVDVACDVITDELTFHYDYLINIVEVTTDEYYYEHCDTVHITVTFTSHTQQSRLVAIRVTIHDDLNVPIASAVLIFTIEGAQYCTPKPYEKQFNLHIDKFAYVGGATIYVVPVMMWEGEWVAAGPEGIGAIYILPS